MWPLSTALSLSLSDASLSVRKVQSGWVGAVTSPPWIDGGGGDGEASHLCEAL